jgi:hypothetical protein
MPISARQSASGVISKSVNGARPAERATPSTSRLVDVPIRVVSPPMIARYDSGIRSLDGATPIVCAS